jgi:D-alanine-D-alanine ligase
LSPARRVGLLFGGRSVEHEVSVTSARAVAEALRQANLVCVPIAVTGDEGRWLSPEASAAILASDAARAEPRAGSDDGAGVVLEPGKRRLVRVAPGSEPTPVEVDCVFPLVHGWGGEDGRVQGALDLAGIPYVGAGVLGSAAAMDKAVARLLMEAQGLPTVRWLTLRKPPGARVTEAERRQIAREIGFPAFVKPANGGSSVGVSRVASPEQLDSALERALACDAKILVEQGIDAREIECAVLGNDAPEVTLPGEIVPSREFYDYAAKYLDGTSVLKIPAPLDPEIVSAVRAHALAAYRCLGLAGLARVDFLVDRGSGQVYLNEVNTLPGFTPISMFPKLWEASGLPFPRLVERLVDLAVERWHAERGRRTVWKAGD